LAWLEAINAPDLGLFLNGRDFSATQEMSEEFRQEINFQGAFGTDGPVLRSVRRADEGTVTFTAILLKRGVRRGLNGERVLRRMRDFEVQVKRGPAVRTYRGCNWTRIAIRSTLDQVTLDCDISIPGFVREPETGLD
jgi:hypothetical protein